ncbi:MAG: class I SAM-dependent methyltransferase [Acidobacteria bacterium]|nr:class I SAM-dependent methyltransferase [Acidobacteriota bacterium]
MSGNAWDQRFSGDDYLYGTEPNDFLREHAQFLPPGRVLSLAEGEGRNGVFLAERGYRVVGADSSAVGLSKARRLAAERGVEIETHLVDLAELEIEPRAWQGVVSIFCHLPRPVRRRLYRQVVEGLAPGGVLLLEAYNPAQLGRGTGGPPVAELMVDLVSLREDLAGLELLHAVELERDIEEGRLHRGPSAVVQVVARRPVTKS